MKKSIQSFDKIKLTPKEMCKLVGGEQQSAQMNQKFSTLSNIMKTRHDTSMNTISNIR